MEWGPCTPLGRGPAAHAREDLPSLKVGLRGKQVGKHGGRGSRANPAAGQVGKAERKWIQTQETGLRNCNQGWGHFCSQKAWGPRGEPCRQRTKSKEGDGQIGAWVSRLEGWGCRAELCSAKGFKDASDTRVPSLQSYVDRAALAGPVSGPGGVQGGLTAAQGALRPRFQAWQ